MRKEERNSLEAVIKRRNLHPTHAACDAIIAFAREVLRVARNCFHEISELFCHSTPATSTTARYECEELRCCRLRKEVFSIKMSWMFVTCFTLPGIYFAWCTRLLMEKILFSQMAILSANAESYCDASQSPVSSPKCNSAFMLMKNASEMKRINKEFFLCLLSAL